MIPVLTVYLKPGANGLVVEITESAGPFTANMAADVLQAVKHVLDMKVAADKAIHDRAARG